MKRGDVWWANLPDATGSTLGDRRPVLIVQHDAYNISAIRTLTVVPFSSNLNLESAPGNVLVSARVSGLSADSVANVSQLLAINKIDLTEQVGKLPPALMARVNDGLRRVLGL